MSTKRVEQLIEDMYRLVESSKPVSFRSNKVAVSRDELFDLLNELQLKAPDEIRRCQKMLANRDAIIEDAKKKALALEEEAKRKAQHLIDANEIMQQACYQATEILKKANTEAEAVRESARRDAEDIRYGALAYTNDMLSQMETVLSQTYQTTKSCTDSLIETLYQNCIMVSANRKELCEQNAISGEVFMKQENEMQKENMRENEDSYQFSEDAFLNDVE